MGNSVFVECCAPTRTHKEEEISTLATNRVELAVSQLFSIPALATAYHTSVLVNGEEFFFSDSGIFSNRLLASHQGTPSERIEMGYSSKTGSYLLAALRPHFQSGTYDLLQKNCNSFSDVALAFLLRGDRLDRRFTAMERLGKSNVELLRRFTNDMYSPNPAAQEFEVDAIVGVVELEAQSERNVSKESATARSKTTLMMGVQVIIVGLAASPHLNGEGAVILRFNAVNGRWEARLNSTGESKAFRAENLRPAGELVLEPGHIVRIHGLQSESGGLLNGLEAEVLRYIHDQARYEVRVGSDTKAIKAENLKLQSG